METLSLPQSWNAKIERIEALYLDEPQIDCPVSHVFSDGLYFRTIFMPAGTFVIGHRHRTRHLNVILQGRASVLINGEVHQVKAGQIFESDAGVKKVLFIHEDMRWGTVHVTEETDLKRLEEQLIIKSEACLEHERQLETLRSYVNTHSLEDQ